MPNPVYDKSKPVLVTGATGFLAGWVVKRLLEEGFTVHAAVRDPSNKKKIAHLEKLADELPGTVKFFAADLLNEGSYSDAMKGCSIVFHTASPFTSRYDDPQRDLIDPAVKGTKNVLTTVNTTKSVGRVVLTSSCAAIFTDNTDVAEAPGGILTEDIWNRTAALDYQPYSYSKTLAERLAWEMADAQDRWKLVTINPALILGPSISGDSTSESHNIIRQFGDGSMKTGVPPMEIGMVDVRDVAEAHIRAAFVPEAEGRNIVFAEVHSFLDTSNMLREKYGMKFPLPRKELPKWLLWLIGPMVNKALTRKMVSRGMNVRWRADNSKSKKVLGIQYGPVSRAVTEMFQQMIDTGAIKGA
jgi:nucleoside-diphosphate-sugar epimerase